MSINTRARRACQGLEDRERLLLAQAILARVCDPRLCGPYHRRAQASLKRLLEDGGDLVVARRPDGSPIGPYGAQNHPVGRQG